MKNIYLTDSDEKVFCGICGALLKGKKVRLTQRVESQIKSRHKKIYGKTFI